MTETGAGAEAAAADATAAHAETTSDGLEAGEGGVVQPPRLASVSIGALLVAPLRVGIAAAVLTGAIAEGLSGEAAFMAVAAGAILLLVLFFADASPRGSLRRRELGPPPPGARYDPWWWSGVRATLPSTLGLTILGTVALGFSTGLAALISGLLLAMGLLSLIFGCRLALNERREHRRLYIEWAIRPRRFVGPSGEARETVP